MRHHAEPPAEPATEPATEPAAKPATLNVAVGLQRCLGDRTLFENIAMRYLGVHAQDPHITRAALAEGDRELALRTAHTLVSSAGTVGAEPLSAMARQLHSALSQNLEPEPAYNLDALAAENERVLAALREELAAAAANAPVA